MLANQKFAGFLRLAKINGKKQLAKYKKMEKKKCYNCKFRSHAFKVGNLTHYHCNAPTYQQQRAEGK